MTQRHTAEIAEKPVYRTVTRDNHGVSNTAMLRINQKTPQMISWQLKSSYNAMHTYPH